MAPSPFRCALRAALAVVAVSLSGCRSTAPKCAGLKHEVCDRSQGCVWDWTGKWETSCIRSDCQGLQHEVCDTHGKMCKWQWTGDWKTSCKSTRLGVDAGESPDNQSSTGVSMGQPLATVGLNQAPTPLGGVRCEGATHATCDRSPGCVWEWTGDWKTSCHSIAPKCAGLKHEVCDRSQGCVWDWTGKWETSCIRTDCQGLQHDVCDTHGKMCKWQWTDDWKTSCKSTRLGVAAGESLDDHSSAPGRMLSFV